MISAGVSSVWPEPPHAPIPSSGAKRMPLFGTGSVSGNRVNQDPAHEIAGFEYLFANKKDFGGDDDARQKLGSVLI
jgi:hypothetical protein